MIGASILAALGAAQILQERADFDAPLLRRAVVASCLMLALGTAAIWTRSIIVGQAPIERPAVQLIHGHVLKREDQPALDRVRLTMAIRDVDEGVARKIRVNIPVPRSMTG